MPVYLSYIAAALLLLFAGWLFWKEWIRPNKNRLGLRLLANFLAVIALLVLIFPIPITSTVPGSATGRHAVLLTEGTVREHLSTLLKKIPADSKIYSFAQYKYEQPEGIDTLHVLGYGLPIEDWEQLKGPVMEYHPAELSQGIVAVDWTRSLRLGKRFRVQGRFNNKSSAECRLGLFWQGLQQDSLVLPPGKESLFELSAPSFHDGNSLYELQYSLEGSKRTESLPVAVSPLGKLKLLVLSANPGFELNFLSSWLAAEGYSLAIRTKLSRDQSSKSFLNMEPIPLESVGKTQLEQFDLVITDEASLSMGTLAAVLQQQMQQSGLGLVINTDTTLKSGTWYGKNFRLGSPVRRGTENIRPLLVREGGRSLLAEKEGTRVGITRLGAGSLVINTVYNSYVKKLQGNGKEYARFWTEILSAAASTEDQGSSQPLFPFPHPFEATQVLERADSVTDTESRSVLFPWMTLKSSWPEVPGWQEGDWYLFNPGDWKELRYAHKLTSSNAFIQQYINPAATGLKTGLKSEDKRLHIGWPLLLFFLSAIFLWVEKKLD